jgi:hypothetical protein
MALRRPRRGAWCSAMPIVANKASAIERANALAPILTECQGMSARQIAAELNARQVATPTGAAWSAKTVLRVRERITGTAPR